MEAITDHTGTTTFIYLGDSDFESLIEIGKQHLQEDFKLKRGGFQWN
jgi:hypothetical protein